MGRLRQPGDSHYDVLGLSPGASDEEIDSAFHQLIDQQGYKVGVPLDRQWLRAREIKAAHAALRDPVKRREYDESLGRATEAAPWAMAASDPTTDELVLPEKEAGASEPVDNELPPNAVVQADQTLDAKPEPTPEAVPEPAAEADAKPEPTPEAVPEPAPEADAKPEPTPEAVPAPAAEAVGDPTDDHQQPPDLVPTLNDNEPAPALDDRKRMSGIAWGAAAVVATGLGVLLLSSWPSGDRQPSTGEGTARVAAPAEQAGGAGPGFVDQAPGNYGLAAAGAEPQATATAGSPAATDTGASAQAAAQDVRQLAAEGTADGQSLADTRSTSTAPEATSRPVEVAARAAAPAPKPPVARTAETAPAPSLRPESRGAMVRSEPEWIGGGPTDADNRRGRYQGTVAVQVTVEPDGRVSRCAPVRGSGNAGLDALTCSIVQQRARFNPALDAQGRPVASQTYTTFFWGRRPRD
ncbi:MAG TPA: TonB family protein [Sphingomicrobium sp.]|nr:TonB family protein [Sphingomicrobium sp.]